MGSHHLRAVRTVSALTACALAVLGLGACGAGSGESGSGKSISIWEGYTGAEQKEFTHLVSVYEKANPGVKINVLYVNNDNTLQKVLTAVRGGTWRSPTTRCTWTPPPRPTATCSTRARSGCWSPVRGTCPASRTCTTACRSCRSTPERAAGTRR